ncbi:MAG: hypothetical protein WC807_03595 [Hyphomicrobium sp.]|jgi:hypothetical protein
MAAFRFLAAVFLLIAVIALVDDATPAIYGAAPWKATTLEGQWAEMVPASLAAARTAIKAATAPWVWDNLILSILQRPTFTVFGLLSLACGFLGRRRHRVEVFVN